VLIKVLLSLLPVSGRFITDFYPKEVKFEIESTVNIFVISENEFVTVFVKSLKEFKILLPESVIEF
jgi:hypothetical protein